MKPEHEFRLTALLGGRYSSMAEAFHTLRSEGIDMADFPPSLQQALRDRVVEDDLPAEQFRLEMRSRILKAQGKQLEIQSDVVEAHKTIANADARIKEQRLIEERYTGILDAHMDEINARKR